MQNFISITILVPSVEPGRQQTLPRSGTWQPEAVLANPALEKGRRDRSRDERMAESTVPQPYFEWEDCVHRAQCCLSVSQHFFTLSVHTKKSL